MNIYARIPIHSLMCLKCKFIVRIAPSFLFFFYKIHTICCIALNIPSGVKHIKLVNLMCRLYIKPVFVYCVSVPCVSC